MKLFHRKIGKSVLVLFLDMALVFTAAFLVLVNLQTRQELEESSRGFYSEEAVSLYCTEENWDGILDILEEGNWKKRHPVPPGSGSGDRYKGGIL